MGNGISPLAHIEYDTLLHYFTTLHYFDHAEGLLSPHGPHPLEKGSMINMGPV